MYSQLTVQKAFLEVESARPAAPTAAAGTLPTPLSPPEAAGRVEPEELMSRFHSKTQRRGGGQRGLQLGMRPAGWSVVFVRGRA